MPDPGMIQYLLRMQHKKVYLSIITNLINCSSVHYFLDTLYNTVTIRVLTLLQLTLIITTDPILCLFLGKATGDPNTAGTYKGKLTVQGFSLKGIGLIKFFSRTHGLYNQF